MNLFKSDTYLFVYFKHDCVIQNSLRQNSEVNNIFSANSCIRNQSLINLHVSTVPSKHQKKMTHGELLCIFDDKHP